MNIDKCIILDDIKLSPFTSQLMEKYKALLEDGSVGLNHLRLADYKRWEVILHFLGAPQDHLDVGPGVGQFPNLLSMASGSKEISACDIKAHSKMQNFSGFDYFVHNITKPLPRKWQSISCLEVIEHIDDDGFNNAVLNLRNSAISQLILTVPFSERLPLSTGHKQRFDKARLVSLFPDADIYYCVDGFYAKWAIINLKINSAVSD